LAYSGDLINYSEKIPVSTSEIAIYYIEEQERTRPKMIKGLNETLNKSVIILPDSAEIPPVLVTPVLSRMLVVTLKKTETIKNA